LEATWTRENYEVEDFVKLVLQMAPTLRKLTISATDVIMLSSIVAILKAMKMLEEFELFCFLFQRDTADTFNCPTLKTFKFNTLHAFNQVLGGMPNLETIVIHSTVTNILLKAINNNCPMLRILKFAHSIPNILQNISFENLEVLSILRVKCDFNFGFLANLSNLQVLRVYDYSLTDQDVQLIVEKAPQLRLLELNEGNKLTAESLNPETTGSLEKLIIHKFNPKYKAVGATLGNLKYYYYGKQVSEPYIGWLKIPRNNCEDGASTSKIANETDEK
jgi:hypothetical protein